MTKPMIYFRFRFIDFAFLFFFSLHVHRFFYIEHSRYRRLYIEKDQGLNFVFAT